MPADATVHDTDLVVRDLELPLVCVRAVEQVLPDDRGVTLVCRTVVLQRYLRDRTGTMLETASDQGPGEPALVRLDVLATGGLRLRLVPGTADPSQVPEHRTAMLEGEVPGPPDDLAVEVTDTQVVLRSQDLRAEIDLDPYRLVLRDGTGRVLTETVPAAVYQHPPTGESHVDGRDLSDAWPWFFRTLTPLGWVTDPVTGRRHVVDTAVFRQREAVYGLGERFLRLDKRGQAVRLWHVNAAGKTWPEAYKNVAFFVSTAGYGHFVNSSAPMTYHLGDSSSVHWTLGVADELLDVFYLVAPTMDGVLDRYTALTGRPRVPPLWTFGLWMSRMSYRTQDEVVGVAEEMRRRGVPGDVVHIDTDWFATPWVNDLEFCPDRFPDPDAMIARLRELGFRLTLWQLPYLSVRSSLYAEAAGLGYLATDRDGSPAHIGGFFGEAGVVDFTDPAAGRWYAEKVAVLLRRGVAAIKTDFGEGAPEDAVYADGDGLLVHNLYPLLYTKAIAEVTEEVTGDLLVWGRSGLAGSQRYPVYWGGDPAVRWSDLGSLLAGGLSLGLSGFPFWSQDIGGFAGTPDARLYVRWAQAGLFMTHPRAHGPVAREPWAFGDEALEIFRTYARVRYGLLPYLWGETHALAPSGSPLMRPLVLDHTDDPSTWDVHDEFLLGRDLLVAPVLTEHDDRLVYVPAGRWWPLLEGEVLTGPGWHTVVADLAHLPLYLRDGALVVQTDPVDHTEQLDWEDLLLDVVPTRDSSRSVPVPGTGASVAVAVTVADGGATARVHVAADRSWRLRVHGGGWTVCVDGAEVPGRPDGPATLHRLPPGTSCADLSRRA